MEQFADDDIALDVNFDGNIEDMDIAVEFSEKDVFVKAAIEKVMSIYWPDPTSNFYCRLCNYLEFNSKESLEKHNEGLDHKLRVSNEANAFCLTCQVHAYNEKLMEKHLQTERHKMLLILFDDAQEKANKFWNQRNNLEKADDQEDEENNDIETSTRKTRHKKDLEEMERIFHIYGENYKQEFEPIKNLLKDFFDSHYPYSGVIDQKFYDVAISICLRSYYPAMKTKNYCGACNNIPFETKEERAAHVKTDLHKAYIAAKKMYYCRICKLNHLNETSYEKHLDDERHKQMSCLLFLSTQETITLSSTHRLTVHNYKSMKEKLYPENGFIKDNDFCTICMRKITVPAEFHVKANKKHVENFNRFLARIQRNYAFSDGCAICLITKEEQTDFVFTEHRRGQDHRDRCVFYEDSLGIVSTTGIAGSFPEAQEFKKRKRARNAAKRKAKFNILRNTDENAEKKTNQNVEESIDQYVEKYVELGVKQNAEQIIVKEEEQEEEKLAPNNIAVTVQQSSAINSENVKREFKLDHKKSWFFPSKSDNSQVKPVVPMEKTVIPKKKPRPEYPLNYPNSNFAESLSKTNNKNWSVNSIKTSDRPQNQHHQPQHWYHQHQNQPKMSEKQHVSSQYQNQKAQNQHQPQSKHQKFQSHQPQNYYPKPQNQQQQAFGNQDQASSNQSQQQKRKRKRSQKNRNNNNHSFQNQPPQNMNMKSHHQQFSNNYFPIQPSNRFPAQPNNNGARRFGGDHSRPTWC